MKKVLFISFAFLTLSCVYNVHSKNRVFELLHKIVNGNPDQLFDAIRKQDFAKTITILARRPDWLHAKNQFKQTPAMVAANNRQPNFLSYLIRQGDNDVASQDIHSFSLLDYIVAGGRYDVLETVVDQFQESSFSQKEIDAFLKVLSKISHEDSVVADRIVQILINSDVEYALTVMPLGHSIYEEIATRILSLDEEVGIADIDEERFEVYKNIIKRLEKNTCSGIWQYILGYSLGCKKFKRRFKRFEKEEARRAKELLGVVHDL